MFHLHLILHQNKIRKVEFTKAAQIGFSLSQQNLVLEKELTLFLNAYKEKKPLVIAFPFCFEKKSAFSKKVLLELQTIPFGKTRSYFELAQLSESKRAYRAIGAICHHNPFPILIPCHRVVAKHHLGGFAFGTKMKQQLLDFEKTLN